MRLGCCYYPEHWPEDWWERDAAEMAELDLTRVRIGEFALVSPKLPPAGVAAWRGG